MIKALKSVMTDDLEHCIITGSDTVHIHHVFAGMNRKNSEKYGFIIPLRPDLHNMSNKGIHFNRELDLIWKRKCQQYFEDNFGTREEFRKVFGKSWL